MRLATRSQNNQNRTTNSNNTSGYKGVSWNKGAGKWAAYICNKRKITHLGLFASIADARVAYCQAAVRLHREFANLGRAVEL